MIMLGNYLNGVMKKNTAGVNGYYNDDSDVAFWAGGDIQKAIATVAKFQNDPRYQPTDAEWADMANFVATHGGDVFMRGYIYALGGLFRGAVSIANGKIQLNADGSGSLASGAYVWDDKGVTRKRYPDMIEWVDFVEVVGDNNTITLKNGGYIDNVYSFTLGGETPTNKTFILPDDVQDGFSLVLRAPFVFTKQTRCATITSNTMFLSASFDYDTGIGNQVTGNKMYVNTYRQNMFSGVRLTYRNGTNLYPFAHWQVEVDGTVGDREEAQGSNDITIWS
jgi:hypothetical protein